MSILTIIIAILVFGFLVFIHEMGHFITARLCGVKVNEFAIGMGPKIFSWVGKKSGVRYSLRILPFGGFTAMEGEDGESEDPDAFTSKPLWKRFIITAAGSLTNLIVGILIMTLLVIFSNELIGGTIIAEFVPNEDGTPALSQTSGLQLYDRIIAVDGERVHTANELSYEIMRRGIEPLDITVERGGETVVVPNVTFPQTSNQGVAFGSPDFKVSAERRTFANVAKHAFFRSELTVEMIWESLVDLVTGRYGVEAVSGPVGVTQVINDAAKSGFSDLVYIAVVLSMNLGIMNLLPLPALDGGRLLFMIIELVRGGKRVNPNVEAMIHFAGIVILLGIMVLVTFKDIFKLFG